MNLEPAGIPSNREFLECIRGPTFRLMEDFSTAFLRRNRANLLYYSMRWSADPLHHLTRQLEYPFAFRQLEAMTPGGEEQRPYKVLDAGAGMTFFPYYLMARYPNVEVTCVDRDAYLGDLYRKVNEREFGEVAFRQADLAKLPYDDDTFDALYCISVLEHTANREEIAEEFARVVKPGGIVVITWDISFEGTKDIPVADGVRLLEHLSDVMEPFDAPALDVERDDVFSSELESEVYTGSIGWRLFRRLATGGKRVLTKRQVQRSRMTVYCGAFRVPSESNGAT